MLRIPILCLLAAFTLSGQRQANSWESQGNLPRSPEIHADRTVTFRLFSPRASEVLLIGSPIVAVLKGAQPLVKDSKGLWSLTVGPLPPGFYDYGFAVDGGIRSPDPSNPNIQTRQWGHTSYLEIPDERGLQEVRATPHGTVHVLTYESKGLGMVRRVYVYTPPGYEHSTARYPVLYLLHAAGLNEEAWTTAGHANNILDNLLAEGKVKPMLLVMPYVHVARALADEPARAPGGTVNEGLDKDLTGDLIPLIERTFRVLPGRENRAIAGNSMGGGAAMTFGLRHPELFSSIGDFSGSVPFQPMLEKMDGVTLNANYKVLWVGCGTEDPVFGSNKAIADLLESKKVRHVFHTSPGVHEWAVWQRNFSEFAPLLFEGK